MRGSNIRLAREAFDILPRREKKKIFLISGMQTLASGLDLVGVAAIGMLTALAVNGVQSRPPGNRVSFVLSRVGLTDFTFHQQVVLLGIFSVAAMVTRTILSVMLSRATLRVLSRISSDITSELVSKLFSRPLLEIRQRSFYENHFALTSGVGSIMIGIVGVVVSLLSDISLLVVLVFGLAVINPLVAFSTLAVFAGIGLSLYFLQKNRAEVLGNDYTKLAISRDAELFSALNIYRELFIRNQRQIYSSRIGSQTKAMADLNAEVSFLPLVNKYVIEATVILGTFIIAAVGFTFQDVSRAVSGLAIFSVAAARIAPGVIRIQQSLILMRSSLGSATRTLEMIQSLKGVKIPSDAEENSFSNHENFRPTIEFESVTFSYPYTIQPVLSDVTFEISPGELVAVIGPSGAGKSTFVDLLLGVMEPTAGKVKISSESPQQAIENSPGAIAYVPQDVFLIPGSLEENVLLGFENNETNRVRAREALNRAQLGDFIATLPRNYETLIGERGMGLSGGQRQRVGIARALVTEPKLIVFDEATSSLDGDTENRVKETIQAMRGKVTQVVVAHRLSTVRDADMVFYIDNGGIRARGTFSDIARLVPNFDAISRQMGLTDD
jgi:ABC-type multidrug transport system fused ATPase/permease subunit